MQIKAKASLFLFSALGFNALAQQNDTIKGQLEEVVVTGQIEPQSINKSVFNVRVISGDDIKRQAGNNLADVLNQYLNIMVMPNNSTGKSTVSMFGLDGQYLKVLVDNVPLVTDNGLGNNVDLTQINLDDIDHIEIIEGSMGVTHGANAVSGIINIITKKSTSADYEVSATAQEETIGKEYEPFANKGRHIQALRVAHSFSPEWFASVGANRNDFTGFQDTRGGENYTPYDPDTPNTNRGYSWLPKEQLYTNATIRYQKGQTRLFYKFDFFNEHIDYYDPVVASEVVTNVGVLRYSNDRKYDTQRFYHHINASGKVLGQLNYNASLSYQQQERDVEIYKYYIQTGEKVVNTNETYQRTKVLYSTGSLSNFFKNQVADLQVGYEFVNTNGFNSALSGTFNNDDQQGGNLEKRLENYDVFAASEIKVTDRFSIRPGARYSFQSKFEDQWAASLGARQLYKDGHEARISIGKSYRTPNYDELYTYMVDANHDIQGNTALLPESGYTAEISGKKTTHSANGFMLLNAVNITYNDIRDRIELAIVNSSPLQYKYININKYRSFLASTSNSMKYKNWDARLGVTLLGISRKIDTGLAASDDKFLFNVQANANVGYTVPQWNTVFSVYYKLMGRSQQFVQTGSIDANTQQFQLQRINSFGLLDASARKSFFDGKLEATLGARNLLDVVNVQSNVAGNSTAHSEGSTNLLMGYGRSYFLKLTYNLNF
jgi:outer membrane receptor for ferrienterochelin and colicins